MASGCSGVRRAAAALVGQVGGSVASIELPALPVADDDGEQLGLSAPEFQQRVLAPVAVRRKTGALELLVAADVLEEMLGVRGEGAVLAAATQVWCVLLADVRYRLTGVEAVRAMGEACLYRMLLDAAGTGVV